MSSHRIRLFRSTVIFGIRSTSTPSESYSQILIWNTRIQILYICQSPGSWVTWEAKPRPRYVCEKMIWLPSFHLHRIFDLHFRHVSQGLDSCTSYPLWIGQSSPKRKCIRRESWKLGKSFGAIKYWQQWEKGSVLFVYVIRLFLETTCYKLGRPTLDRGDIK